MVDADRMMCIERLRRRASELDKILSMLKDRDLFDEGDKAKLGRLMAAFLGRLELQDLQCLKSRKKGKLTDIEKDFYFPAVQGVLEQVNANVSSISDEVLHIKLKSAKKRIEYYINSLELLSAN